MKQAGTMCQIEVHNSTLNIGYPVRYCCGGYLPVGLMLEQEREERRKRREKLVLWKSPLTTLLYFIRELLLETKKLTLA